MTAPGTVLILDADSVLSLALTDELVSRGYRVIAHTRAAPRALLSSHVVHVVCAEAAERIPMWSEACGPFTHVIFGCREAHEAAADLENGAQALISMLQAQIFTFLSELQSAAQAIARQDGGQIWVITQEDSMQYYMPAPAAPIVTRARHAAVKSFAREVLRLGIRINCATVQLLEEQAQPAAWRDARGGLKAFAMKFKPVKASAAARTLYALLSQRDLALAGMVVPLGVGMPENNL